jgi:LmbE family N-acetylglucosaminyl deacetylase
MKDLFVVAHPDDAEAMLGYAIAQSTDPYVVVATDGKASTIDEVGDGFVQAGKRRLESVDGLSKLGVPEDHQYYLDLSDGGLTDAIGELTARLQELFGETGIARIFTAGPDGYDGHPDHIAAHKAAVSFCTGLRQSGHEVTLFGLVSDHTGELRITGDQAQKTAALAAHVSQSVTPDITRWGNVDIYTPLIVDAETYDAHKAS